MFQVRTQGAVRVLSGEGAVNSAATEELSRMLETCLGGGQTRIIFDLAGVPLFDSAGLEWILEAAERCARGGGCLQLAGANTLGRDILRVTGVQEEFELFEDVVSAVRSFSR